MRCRKSSKSFSSVSEKLSILSPFLLKIKLSENKDWYVYQLVYL